jgi:hypothetical protein
VWLSGSGRLNTSWSPQSVLPVFGLLYPYSYGYLYSDFSNRSDSFKLSFEMARPIVHCARLFERTFSLAGLYPTRLCTLLFNNQYIKVDIDNFQPQSYRLDLLASCALSLQRSTRTRGAPARELPSPSPENSYIRRRVYAGQNECESR